MALFVHHGPRLAVLADGVVRRLAAPSGDPFERSVVAVPTAGVRDWLTRRLAAGLGIAANVDMPYTARFFATALGRGDDDPWSVERLTWAVLDVLATGGVDVPGWAAACSGPASQRYLVARRIADLFDRYAAVRPEVLRQWQRGVVGDGTLRATPVGGASEPGDEHTVGTLPSSMRWQYELWRRVRHRLGTPSVAEATPELVERLRCGELEPMLPPCVELFGTSSLSRSQLDVLVALAARRDVHVSMLHPSIVAWQRTRPIDRAVPVPRARRGDPDAVETDRHPLLRSWGRPSSEAAGIVRGLQPPVTIAAVPGPTPTTPATLLAHLQADLTADRAPTPFAPAPGDRSVQIHACHGTIRQLEVLRDALGHLFVADPSLRPDDVLVICPDLARFEPFLAAVFGRGALPVPVSVSDLSLGTENPVAAAVGTILRTVVGRCTASDVLAVAGLDPVRRNFGFTAEDLDRFAQWCDRLATSWGLDGVHRASWLATEITPGSWDHAVRSLLLGAAMPAPEPRAVGGTVLFDDVTGDDIGRAGRLAELVARLRSLHRLTSAPRTIGEWCDIFDDVVDRFCAVPHGESWQRAAVLAAIDEIRSDARVGGLPSAVPVAFDDAVAAVDEMLVHRRGRLQLRTGRVSVTGNTPVRNVPARVVCVLGCDEPDLRPPGLDGDDLLAIRPCVGERERHAERRHLLLDALLAAEDALVVTCDGSDITTNREVRPAVPVSELLDCIDTTLEAAGSGSTVLVRHPLHAYAARNFDLAAEPPGGARSFDDAMCHAAEIRRQRSEIPGSSTWRRFRVDCPIPATVDLRQLSDACVRPARALLCDGLDVRVPGEIEPIDDAIPLGLGRLEAASAGRRLLDRYRRQAAALRAAGHGGDRWQQAATEAVEAWAAAERLGPAAPPGTLIEGALAGLAADIDVLVAAISTTGLDPCAVLAAGGVIDVDVELAVTGAFTARVAGIPERLRLVDRVGGLADGVVCRVGYQRPRPATVVAAALDLAAVVLATGDPAWRAFTATRAANGTGAAECHLLDVTADAPLAAARTLLEVAAELRVAALSGAVPLFEATSRVLYEKGFIDEDELAGNDFGKRGDLDDVHNHFVWGDVTAGELDSLEPSPGVLANAIWGAIDAFASPRRAGERVAV